MEICLKLGIFGGVEFGKVLTVKYMTFTARACNVKSLDPKKHLQLKYVMFGNRDFSLVTSGKYLQLKYVNFGCRASNLDNFFRSGDVLTV
jgi:hypothetical protein